MKTPDISMSLAVALATDGASYLAIAPHLNLVGFGKTEDEALKDFDKAVSTFLKFHHKNGTFEAKLLSLGWQKSDHTHQPPSEFKVPTYLLEGGRKLTGNKTVNVPAYA